MAIELAPDAAPSTRLRSLRRLHTVAGPWPWLGFAGALVIAVTAPLWRLAGPHAWRLTVPFLPHDGSRPFTAIVFVLGVIALGFAWVGLIHRIERSEAPTRVRMRVVLATAALWFLPVMLGPPLLSSDVYSYAGEGDVIAHGHDPTTEGMNTALYGFITHVDPVWRKSVGNPYGPVQMGVAGGVVEATSVVNVGGQHFDTAIWMFRLITLAAVFASVWGIAEIARHHRVSPPVAVAIGIANPIVVLHLVGGGHNDALLMALLATGLALSLRGRHWPAIACIALATAVKLPAAAALLYVGWAHPGVRATVRERVRSVTKAVLAAGVIIEGLCVVVGIGLVGWIVAAKNTGTTTGTLSLSTRAGYVFGEFLRLIGLDTSNSFWMSAFRLVGLAAAAYLAVRLLGAVHRVGVVAATAIAILGSVLLGPVVWPWYLAPGFALLGATQLGRWRPSLLVLCAIFAGEVFPVGQNSRPVLEGNHLFSVVLLVIITAVTVCAPAAVEWWQHGTIPAWWPSRARAAMTPPDAELAAGS